MPGSVGLCLDSGEPFDMGCVIHCFTGWLFYWLAGWLAVHNCVSLQAVGGLPGSRNCEMVLGSASP